MHNRRRFLTLILGALPVPAAFCAAAAKRPAVRFTKNVREVNRRLAIKPGRWKRIICHHSGTKNGNAASYDREHRARGMENGLAYHFVIGNGIGSKDGAIEIGSRWVKQIKGGHVKSDDVNEVAIGICLVGNFDQTKPTKNQLAALHELITYLRDEVVGRSVKFEGHNEAHPGHTACPGRNFPLKEFNQRYG